MGMGQNPLLPYSYHIVPTIIDETLSILPNYIKLPYLLPYCHINIINVLLPMIAETHCRPSLYL